MEATQALLLENIRRIRKEKGMSQQMVADGAGMHVPTYSRLERGGSNPSLTSIVRIANSLDVPVVELFQSSDIKDRSIAQKLEMIESMSEVNQSVVTILLDSLIEKDRLEKSQEVQMKTRLKELEEAKKK